MARQRRADGTERPEGPRPAGEGRALLREGTLTLPDGLPLRLGGRILPCQVAWRLLGPADAPVVAVMGGISADRRVCGAPGSDEPDGWWEGVAGTGGAIDPDRWRILSFDFLAGPGGSSAPAPRAPGSVPTLMPADQADALAAVMDHLGIARLRAVIGASYGGAVALAFAAEHADRAEAALVIGAAHQSHPMATALRVIQRRIVAEAQGRGADREGLALARVLAMTTYRSPEEFEHRFTGPARVGPEGLRFPVEDYLDHHGRAFADRFDAVRFLCLSLSMDLQDVDPAQVGVPVTLVAMEPDAIAPPWLVQELHARLGPGHALKQVPTTAGHDGFLTDVETFRQVAREFLEGR